MCLWKEVYYLLNFLVTVGLCILVIHFEVISFLPIEQLRNTLIVDNSAFGKTAMMLYLTKVRSML